MTLDAGTKLGRYEIRSQLGAGGMGEVYLAMDEQLRRKVALKLLPVGLTKDEDRVRRFEQEARATSALNHPNILTIYEIGQAEGEHYIASEYVEGQTLRHVLAEQGKFEVVHTLDTCIQIVSALTAAHSAGVVHRDIKPENVMLRPDGIVKVLDFGLAKLTENKDGAPADSQAMTRALVNTNPGFVMGTVAYMSPEQVRGEEIDVRTDIFSAGVVTFEMLTGKLPFAGKTSSDVMAAVLTSEPLRASEFSQQVPPELERIISKTLSKDREERYQTAKDLLVDLRRLKKQIDVETELKRSSASQKRGEQATEIIAGRATATRDTRGIGKKKLLVASALMVLLVGALVGYSFWRRRVTGPSQIGSIAVLPFQNVSGNPDVEYLSDGITDSLINSLSQLPNLSVKARTSVFRYKGQDIDPQTIGSQLSVQAILSGRVVQRADDLTLYLALVDANSGNQLWGEQYNRKMADLVALQTELVHDVSQKLRATLSGADRQKLAKNYATNVEAYQLFLKGRYQIQSARQSGIQTGIANFQEAIAQDPTYALAYTGLAEAYLAVALSGETPSTEAFSKAKAAAQKAVEIDNALPEAHVALSFIYLWYDWDWSATERQVKHALELNPNSGDAHLVYAALLTATARHAEAIPEAARARDLEPLNLRNNALEGLFLTQAGRVDEGITRLQKTLEMEPNFYLAHILLAGAYIDKGMYPEAVAKARRARELSPGLNNPLAFLGYALAKWEKQKEARAVLDELLRASKDRYVSPYSIAMVYNGLGERAETFKWLVEGFEKRDLRMTQLKIDRKWDNLRSEPQYHDLLRKLNLAQ